LAISIISGQLASDGNRNRAARQTVEGAQHPDRNAQFEHIHAQAEDCFDPARELRAINIDRKDFHGDWNYVFSPRREKP
jgi:hypothetical protein